LSGNLFINEGLTGLPPNPDSCRGEGDDWTYVWMILAAVLLFDVIVIL